MKNTQFDFYGQEINPHGFFIDKTHILQALDLCSFKILEQKLLFGIRGANLLSPKGVWLDKLKLQEVALDHVNPCCILGIFDIKTGQSAAFTGSTVPNILWIKKQQQNPEQRIANLLGTGLHSYYIGAHEPLNAAIQEGSWRMNRLQDVAVWRLLTRIDPNFDPNLDLNLKDNLYDLSCHFESCCPDDNIHDGQILCNLNSNPNSLVTFSSAGCQTLATQEFQEFRIMAGQSKLPSLEELGIFYNYLLLDSQYYHKLVLDKENILKRILKPVLMQGSSGASVGYVQDQLIKLGFLKDAGFNKGHYNGRTSVAVYKFQRQNNLRADGIIKEQDLECLSDISH